MGLRGKSLTILNVFSGRYAALETLSSMIDRVITYILVILLSFPILLFSIAGPIALIVEFQHINGI